MIRSASTCDCEFFFRSISRLDLLWPGRARGSGTVRRRRARVRRERVRRGVLHAKERIGRPIEDTLVPLRGILRAVTAVLLGGGGAGRIAWRRDAAQQVDGGDLVRLRLRLRLRLRMRVGVGVRVAW